MSEGSKFDNFEDGYLKSAKFSQNFSKIAFLLVMRCNPDYDSKLRITVPNYNYDTKNGMFVYKNMITSGGRRWVAEKEH
jgi:hypothetical protein